MSLIIQFVASMININELQEEFLTTGDITLILERIREFVVPIIIISLINLFFTDDSAVLYYI